MKGQTIKIFLVNGTPSGIMIAEIMNWTGMFTVVPRTQLAELAKRKEVKRRGIYILAGQNPQDPTQDVVYIGESENIWTRLIQHNNDASKEFWGKTIIITSKDENLTKAHIRYLESCLINIAKQAQRSQVINNTNPEFSGLPETDISDMNYYLEQIQMILPVLGFTFTNRLPQTQNSTSSKKSKNESPIFILNYKGAIAEAKEVNGEFIVFERSTACKLHTSSLTDSYIQLRKKMEREVTFVNDNNSDLWVLTKNVSFQSPSTAARIIAGTSLNGRAHWKVKDTGQSYSDWQDEQIKKAT